MAMISINENGNNSINILLTRNHSATWPQTKRMLLMVFICVGAIASYWLWRGIWIILPFAGLEVGLLAWLSYRVNHRSYQTQLLEFDNNTINVTNAKNDKAVFCRQFTQVEAHKPHHSMSADTLYITDGFKRLELGDGLCKDDIDALKATLRRLTVTVKDIGRVRVNAMDNFES